MSSKLIALLTIHLLTVVYGLPGNILINLPQLNQNELNWPQEKIQTLEYILNSVTDNITLIGWQKIWNADGSLKEIRTIEVTFQSGVPKLQRLALEELDIYEEIPVLTDLGATLSSAGLGLSGFVTQVDRDGTVANALIFDQETISLQDPNGVWTRQWNITEPNLTLIEQFIANLKDKSSFPVGVLRWNTDGSLNVQSSKIEPIYLTNVYEVENATLSVIETAILGVSKGGLLYPNSLPKYVAGYLRQKIPGYNWVVAEDALDTHLEYDVYLNIGFSQSIILTDTASLDIYGITV